MKFGHIDATASYGNIPGNFLKTFKQIEHKISYVLRIDPIKQHIA